MQDTLDIVNIDIRRCIAHWLNCRDVKMLTMTSRAWMKALRHDKETRFKLWSSASVVWFARLDPEFFAADKAFGQLYQILFSFEWVMVFKIGTMSCLYLPLFQWLRLFRTVPSLRTMTFCSPRCRAVSHRQIARSVLNRHASSLTYDETCKLLPRFLSRKPSVQSSVRYFLREGPDKLRWMIDTANKAEIKKRDVEKVSQFFGFRLQHGRVMRILRY